MNTLLKCLALAVLAMLTGYVRTALGFDRFFSGFFLGAVFALAFTQEDIES